MNIHPTLLYKVVEFSAGLSIVAQDSIVNMPGVTNLIIASMPTCCEYLARYTEQRARGKEPKEAHQLALRGANVVSKGNMDG